MLDEFLNLRTYHLVVCSFHFIIFTLFASNYILWQAETSQNIRSIYYIYHSIKNDFTLMELPQWLSSKFICNAGDARNMGLIPVYGGSPRGEIGNPLQCSARKVINKNIYLYPCSKRVRQILFSTMAIRYMGSCKGFSCRKEGDWA